MNRVEVRIYVGSWGYDIVARGVDAPLPILISIAIKCRCLVYFYCKKIVRVGFISIIKKLFVLFFGCK